MRADHARHGLVAVERVGAEADLGEGAAVVEGVRRDVAHADHPASGYTVRVSDPRGLLESERVQTLQRLAALSDDFAGIVDASRDTNADDEHDPEGATIAFERSQVDALVRQARHHLAEIDAALERVEAGSYGVCVRCGEPIAAARLEARPTARTCVECVTSVGGPG